MTDSEIREWLAIFGPGKPQPEIATVYRNDVYALLKELLEHRSLKLTPCWRVWCPDQTAQGWRWVAAFPRKEAAMEYRELISGGGCLILPHNEEPALTAR